MNKSRLRNKFLKTSTIDKKRAYDKQCNNVVSLLRNEKKNYSNLDTKVANNRIVWKTVKPFLSEKVTKHFKTNLVQGEKIISCDEKIVKTFIEYVINIKNLNMPSHICKCPDSLKLDIIFRIIHKYGDHPGITLIKTKNNSRVFTLHK